MNMCMIQDDKGNVLALDKVNDSYTGTTFPGGHVEANEIFQKSMIREVIAQYGIDAIFSAVVKELYRKGETKEQLLQKIGRYPISKEN